MRQLVTYIIAAMVLCSWIPYRPHFIPVDNLQVRIYAHLKISSLSITQMKGSYRLTGDGNKVATFAGAIPIWMTLSGDSIEVRSTGTVLGRFKYLRITSALPGEFKIKLQEPDRPARIYPDDMSLSVIDGGIKLINEVDLDHYIAGVTEAEAGRRSYAEFYKVQAILARTFALSHINKHVTEGFSLCDQVHCQAYFGKPRDPQVFLAVENTRGQVVVDENLNLIVAAFHSNSGGQTANSEDVWGAHTSYLRSVNDTFSTRMPNANWQRKMPADDWLTYLKLKHNYPVEEEDARMNALNFTQESRKNYLEYKESRVPLKNVRQDLQLKSTYFSVKCLNKDTVLLIGKGYGHGLGMCQEGAMRMAKLGYHYPDILNYYYKDIQLIDLHKLDFFRDE